MSQNSGSSNELANQIMSIVDDSDMSREQKQLLRELFQNLALHQNKKLDDLFSMVQSSIYEAEHTSESIGHIVVALLPIKHNLRGFFPMFDFSQVSFPDDDLDDLISYNEFIGAYFKCSYDRFLEITDSGIPHDYDTTVELINGSIIKCKCSFRLNYSYVYQEKLLQVAASQYGLETPLIYSPYSRKFAKIVFSEDISISQIQAIHIPCLSQDLAATTIDHKLMWNIEVTNRRSPELPVSQAFSPEMLKQKALSSDTFTANEYVVAGSTPSYKSKYACYPNEYIIFDGVGTRRLAIARDIKESCLYIMYDGQIKIEPIKRIKVNPVHDIMYDIDVLVKQNAAHINSFKATTFIKRRLRSNADIIYSLSAFQQNEYNISIADEFNIFEECPSECISEYQNAHRYYKYQAEQYCYGEIERSILNTRALFCCLTFKGNNPFKEDFARYVLSFMNEYYPEFHWVGRCE
ncbi:hypothetical protein [Ruminococcus flavefaciens]|uniref:hypothetical protein n=1 Tax=Ruminococcus flavefaciens TaxID=1265 RepID=UPI000491D1CA|nr:hypothetical protein [Ruminococcus flavefaciens]